MARKREAADGKRMRVYIARGIAVLVVLIILILLGRALIRSAFSCVSLFDSMEYVDEDERERLLPWNTPMPASAGLTDQAYDRVFPDLVEPTLSP